jgi:hypothetical protein
LARRLGRWVYFRNETSGAQKAEAAELVAVTYEDDAEQALTWYQNSYRTASGERRTRVANAIRALGGTVP